MNILWLDPGFGASGDMLLGALVGLGAPLDAIVGDVEGLGIDGWELEHAETDRAGISATRVEVKLQAHEGHGHHRAWSKIDALLAEADLPEEVATGSRKTFRALAEVEAAIHSVDIDQVHFHEVGAVDAIVDIVGTWSALHHLRIAEVRAAPIGLGSGGTVDTAHGELPVPAPATLALLRGSPVRGLTSPTETVTPTGAALLTTIVDQWGPIPDGCLVANARGAGGRNPKTHPNVLSALLLQPEPQIEAPVPGADVIEAMVLATNVDDVTPEVLGATIERLLQAGADDAWLIPIGMKKNRPGNELRVLCRPERAAELMQIVFAETGTLGLRTEPVTKIMLQRHSTTVTIHGLDVRMKIGPNSAKPEHDDLVHVSSITGLPIRKLAAEAVDAHLAAIAEGVPGRSF